MTRLKRILLGFLASTVLCCTVPALAACGENNEVIDYSTYPTVYQVYVDYITTGGGTLFRMMTGV